MGRGWRRAFCTSVDHHHRNHSEGEEELGGGGGELNKRRLRLSGLFSSSLSNPSTPRLSRYQETPPLQCKTNTIPQKLSSSSPSTPRSPSTFSLLKTALRLSRNRCGICAGSVKSSGEQRTAVFTAECSHLFHFPCISAHVRTHSSLVCPVCSATWHEVPMLSSSLLPNPSPNPQPNASAHRQRVAACKVYDDDESLAPSPTSPYSSQLSFNSIPEEEEEEEQQADIQVMQQATALLSTDRNHQIYVVAVKVRAPARPASNTTGMNLPPGLLDPSRRAPIDLVTVLDASATMTAQKLQMLKRAMRLLISSLGPADRLSIVAFSSVAAKRLLPLRRMARPGQRSARQIVDRLVVCGGNQNRSGNGSSSSCAGDALRKATKVLEDRRERNPVATIILLSDVHGQQQQQQENQQVNHRQQRRASSSSVSPGTRFAHLEIPIHNSEKIEKQEDDDESLTKRVNGLVSVVMQDVHLHLAFPCGVISSVYSYQTSQGIGRGSVAHGEGGRSVRLGDMYAEEEREILVEIRVPKTAVVDANSFLSMSVACSYHDPVSGKLVQCAEKSLEIMQAMTTTRPTLLRSSSSTSSTAATSATTSQEQQAALRNTFVITRAMAESQCLVDLNQLDTAERLISSARSLLLQQSNWSKVPTNKKYLVLLETELARLQQQQRREQQQSFSPSIRRNTEQTILLGESTPRSGSVGPEQPLTPTSAWRAAEQLAKVAIMRKSMNRVSDLHGLENARF